MAGKFSSLSLALGLVWMLVSCKSKVVDTDKQLLVTLEPQRYFLEQLVGDLYTVNTVVPPGTSPETYDPTPAQMARFSTSAAYFTIGYIGFELTWLDKIKSNTPQLLIIDTSEGVDLIHTGEDAEEHHHHHADGHSHHDLEEGHHHHHGPIDPHIWNSPKQALVLVKNMYQALCAIDPEHADRYYQNWQQVNQQILRVDSLLTDKLSSLSSTGFVIYHPALSYLARDYGLQQLCIENEGKEPSPVQLQQLSKQAKEAGIKVVFIQEEFDKKNAETIAQEIDAQLIAINPLSYFWEEELLSLFNALSHE